LDRDFDFDDYLTVDEIIELTPWSKGYVRNLASKEGWGTMGTRPQRYALQDVVKRLTR
jgi:hypothetical protein